MDIQYLLFLQEMRAVTHNVFDPIFLLATRFGDPYLAVMLMAFMYWCVNKRLAVYLLLNLQLGGIVNQFLKITACVYRPWIRSDLIVPVESAKAAATGYSFPSGHTALATALWGGLAVFFQRRKLVRNALVIVILLVGFSRNYLGVHTPQDVVVSLLVGSLLLYTNHKILVWLDEDPSRDRYICAGGVLLNMILMAYALTKTYPVDYVNGVVLVDPERMIRDSFKVAGASMGFFIGWFIERRWVCFDERVGAWRQRLIVFIGGCVMLVPLITLFNRLCTQALGHLWGNALSWAIILIFIMAGYPLIVHKIRQNRAGLTQGT